MCEIYSNLICNISDTLRYFYSAAFQGFAAIVTLGIMFYLYFVQDINNRIKSIEDILYQHCLGRWPNAFDEINRTSLSEFCDFQI